MLEQTNRIVALIALLCISTVSSVDHSKFKTCEQSGFCRRNRDLQAGQSKWELDPSTVQSADGTVEALLKNPDNEVVLKLRLSSLLDDGSILRMHIDELKSERHRFEALEALKESITLNKLDLVEKNADNFRIRFGPEDRQFTAVITHKPFKIDVYSGSDLILVGNERGLFNFEHYRKKESVEEKELTDQVSKGMCTNRRVFRVNLIFFFFLLSEFVQVCGKNHSHNGRIVNRMVQCRLVWTSVLLISIMSTVYRSMLIRIRLKIQKAIRIHTDFTIRTYSNTNWIVR